jgi:hypothetical protein
MRFYDPTGKKYGIPTYPWALAPDGLMTRGQLREWGLRPGGQPIAAQIMWRSKRVRRQGSVRVAYLYRRDLALLIRPMTPGRQRALDAANLARRTCPTCRRDVGYVIRTSLGTCEPCDTTRAPAALAA